MPQPEPMAQCEPVERGFQDARDHEDPQVVEMRADFAPKRGHAPQPFEGERKRGNMRWDAKFSS